MDMQTTPDHLINSSPADPASPAAARVVPLPAPRARRHRARRPDRQPGNPRRETAAAQELFDSLHPGDPADALLAAIAIAAAQAAMDSFARAARPGISDETAVSPAQQRPGRRPRLRRVAARPPQARTRRRAAQAGRGSAHARKAPPVEPTHDVPEVPPGFIALRPGAKPIPAVETFQPRDRFGEPIPDLRTDLMTRAQLRASLTIPRDPVLEAEALAEEAAMMAEQAAMDAAARTGTG